MRALMSVAILGLAAAACSPQQGAGNNAQSANAADATYRPPTVTSRADYGGRIERRFKRLDKNGDLKIDASELPERMKRRLERDDTSGDGALDSAEFGAMMLARFDRQDINKDGTLTSDERRQRRGGRREAAAAADPVDNMADDALDK